MKKTLDKRQSIFVLMLMSLFCLFILFFSLKVLNQAKDINLQAEMSRINVFLLEYYIENNFFPKEASCNLKKNCLNFKKEINIFIDKDIYYNSNEKDYTLYSPSFGDNNVYYVTGPNLVITKTKEIQL